MINLWKAVNSVKPNPEALLMSSGFCTGLLCTWSLTPFIIRFATKFGISALQDRRRRHEKSTPLLGGTGIFLALFGTSFLLTFLNTEIKTHENLHEFPTLAFMVSLTSIFLLGVLDDSIRLRANRKVIIQSIASTLFLLSQIPRIQSLNFSASTSFLIFLFLDILMIGITNSVNLIDGMDGLCSGTGAIIAITYGVLLSFSGSLSYKAIILSASLSGACFGFIKYNWNPAKIFLGDSGSLTIGFTLACFSVEVLLSHFDFRGAFMALLPLMHPLIDTTTTLCCRLKSGRPLFLGDRSHLHHRLFRLGVSQRRVVVLLWLVSVYSGLQAFFMLEAPVIRTVIILLSLSLLTSILIMGLAFIEKSLSLQLARFGQASLNAQISTQENDFFLKLETYSYFPQPPHQTVSILVIDYLRILPQMINQSLSQVDTFFSQCYEMIHSDTQTDRNAVQLSETITAIILGHHPESSEQKPDAIFRRVSENIYTLQQNFGIATSDALLAEGVIFFSDLKAFGRYCDRVKVGSHEFRKSLKELIQSTSLPKMPPPQNSIITH